MAERIIEVPHFNGEQARVVVGDFGPFGIETILFQVLRDKRRWWGGMRQTWVTLYSCFLDGDEGMDKGYTLDQWTEATAVAIRELLEEQNRKARERETFYAKD